jgi:hypothetical protein
MSKSIHPIIKQVPQVNTSSYLCFYVLSPDELGKLAKRMAEAKDPAEASRLKKEIVRGFYGGQSHA